MNTEDPIVSLDIKKFFESRNEGDIRARGFFLNENLNEVLPKNLMFYEVIDEVLNSQ